MFSISKRSEIGGANPIEPLFARVFAIPLRALLRESGDALRHQRHRPLKANDAVVRAVLALLHPVRRMPELCNELVCSEPCGRADDPIRAVSRSFAVDRGRTCTNDRAAKLVEIRGREDAVR